MSSGAFKAKFKPMNGGIQIRPTPTVKAVSAPLLILYAIGEPVGVVLFAIFGLYYTLR